MLLLVLISCLPRTSDLDHFEIFLPCPALGTGPIHGDIGPGGAGCEAVFGISGSLVIDPTADEAHPGPAQAHELLSSITTMREIVDMAPPATGGKTYLGASCDAIFFTFLRCLRPDCCAPGNTVA